MLNGLTAGAAARDISPRDSQFLYGYPHVPRYSTGIHDPLLSSALYLTDGASPALLIANDIIWVSRRSSERIRKRIAMASDVPAGNIMITATHTHSGPMSSDCVSNEADPVVPGTDPNYVAFLEDSIVACAAEAIRRAQPAEAGLALADGSGAGGNRRDPAGPSDPEVPVFAVRSAVDRSWIACMLVCSVHPTVLHEDSTLVSADFPGMARRFLQRELLGACCPVLHHTGPSGNQSPRHVTRANTFEEAERLGSDLGKSVVEAVARVSFSRNLPIAAARAFVDLPRRSLPPVSEAEQKLAEARERLAELRRSGARRQEVRTAEVDVFGAEETLTLSVAAAEGRLDAAYAAVLPAEVQVLSVGPYRFVGWPGEVFVEYALEVKSRARNTFVISLANGELQGYIVTEEAVEEHAYEAGNALFAPAAGSVLVDAALRLLA